MAIQGSSKSETTRGLAGTLNRAKRGVDPVMYATAHNGSAYTLYLQETNPESLCAPIVIPFQTNKLGFQFFVLQSTH